MKKHLIALLLLALLSFTACQQVRAPEPSDTVNKQQTDNPITLDNLQSGGIVKSPLEISGTAKGWYFEAEFPVLIYDNKDNLLGRSNAIATEDWMTDEPVPFEATINFDPGNETLGKIVFEKANPSGLPENDETYELPVRFK